MKVTPDGDTENISVTILLRSPEKSHRLQFQGFLNLLVDLIILSGLHQQAEHFSVVSHPPLEAIPRFALAEDTP